ncbi:MAG TPA: type II secretion system F family protein [Patescibacteria group bacterium]|nr:type II secretion system F family protein [Patescibacteria group bacterium]
MTKILLHTPIVLTLLLVLPFLYAFMRISAWPVKLVMGLRIVPVWNRKVLERYLSSYQPSGFWTPWLNVRALTTLSVQINYGGVSWQYIAGAKILAVKYGLVLGVLWWVMEMSVFNAMVGIAIALTLYLWPEFYFKRKINSQTLYFTRTLSSVLDLLKIQVGSGLTLEQSIDYISRTRTDAWAHEMAVVSRLNKAGFTLEAALERVMEHVQVEDFVRFVGSLKQAKTLGASLSKTLEIQAGLIRQRRKQAAEEKAKTAAVRIVLPLVLCIFPALLIVFLGPAILRLTGGF